MQKYLIKDIAIVNDNQISYGDVLIADKRIEKVGDSIDNPGGAVEINGSGKYLMPGAIDDQVHFREPGLTHKATVYTESKAAVRGGVTSFMEMPNTVPPVFTQDLLEQKYEIGRNSSLANYSFFMGTSNENVDEALRVNEKKNSVCGIKVFMGSSTGGLLVDNYVSLGRLFRESEVLIATHCEDEQIIRDNLARLKAEKGTLQPADHPLVRDEDACFESSFRAVQMAKQFGTRLHILHISTAKELQLFGNMLPLKEKRITAEVCVHHLHFTAEDYPKYGNLIKCNPAIKAPHHREALWEALLDDRLDVIATDHAPHTMDEKNEPYEKAHAGAPLVQHSMMLMLQYWKEGRIPIEKIAQKMSHSVADCFNIKDRGYIKEGYFADLVIVDPAIPDLVTREGLQYKCGWSPFEGHSFPVGVTHTFVNGHLAFHLDNGKETWDESQKGERLTFSRS